MVLWLGRQDMEGFLKAALVLWLSRGHQKWIGILETLHKI
jgi:hypothetical protein